MSGGEITWKSGDWPGLAMASSHTLDHDDDDDDDDDVCYDDDGDDDDDDDCYDDDGDVFHGVQEFAEHFMVQVWREGRQVWEDYRDAQVRNFDSVK